MGAADGVVGSVSLDPEASVLPAGRGEASSLSVLVDGVNDPVDARVVANHDMLGVDEDDLKVLVGGVLVDPVRV